MPTASSIGLSATTICIVEQFGFATIPRCAAIASGLTSATTSGTSSCMRQKLELSTTTAPADTMGTEVGFVDARAPTRHDPRPPPRGPPPARREQRQVELGEIDGVQGF